MILCRKNRTPKEILDVRGLRLIVTDENSCYKALDSSPALEADL